jgi:hypothetical protein
VFSVRRDTKSPLCEKKALCDFRRRQCLRVEHYTGLSARRIACTLTFAPYTASRWSCSPETPLQRCGDQIHSSCIEPSTLYLSVREGTNSRSAGGKDMTYTCIAKTSKATFVDCKPI